MLMPIFESQEWHEFVQSAGDAGVVLFSLGSYAAADMDDRMVELFADAFSRIPQKVIWQLKRKEEQSYVVDIPANVKISGWIPQNDLLGKYWGDSGLLRDSEARELNSSIKVWEICVGWVLSGNMLNFVYQVSLLKSQRVFLSDDIAFNTSRVMCLVCERSADRNPGEPFICSAP